MSEQEKKPTTYQKRITQRVCDAILDMDAGVGHDAENKHHRYTYASIDAVYAHTREPLAKAGLDVRSQITETEIVPAHDAKKTPWLAQTVEIGFESVEGEIEPTVTRYIMTPLNGPQTFSAALSYVEKYWLRERLRLATGDVDVDEQEQVALNAAPPPTAQNPNAEWIVQIGPGPDLTIDPEPTPEQWRRSQSLHRELFRAIAKELVGRDTKKARETFMQTNDMAKAYVHLPPAGREKIEALIKHGTIPKEDSE